MNRHVIYKIELQEAVGQNQIYFETIDGYMQTVFGKYLNKIQFLVCSHIINKLWFEYRSAWLRVLSHSAAHL